MGEEGMRVMKGQSWRDVMISSMAGEEGRWVLGLGMRRDGEPLINCHHGLQGPDLQASTLKGCELYNVCVCIYTMCMCASVIYYEMQLCASSLGLGIV